MNPYWNLIYAMGKIGIEADEVELDEAAWYIEKHNRDMKEINGK